ncbi:MAG TPA: DUF4836 family protein [Chitinophagaceae bacterium]
MPVKKSIAALTVTVLAALLFFSSCSRLPEQTKYIPKEAVMVMGINGKSLVQKGAWSELTGDSVLQHLKAAVNPQQQEYLNHPAETGVNTLSTFYVFFKPDPRFGNGYTGVIAPLNNADKFAAFMQKSLDTIPVKKEGDISSMLIGKKGLLAWNKRVAVLLIPAANSISTDDIKQIVVSKDSLFSHLNSDYSGIGQLLHATDTAFNAPELYAEMHRLFTLSKSSAISSNDKFVALQEEAADMTFWVNMQELYKAAPPNSPLLRADYFDNSYLAAAVNFNNGAIEVTGKSYANDQLMAIARKYSGPTIDMHSIKDLPSANIVALMAAAFKPDYIKAVLNYYGLDGMINLALDSQGLNLDTLLHAFSGNVLIGATDLKVKPAGADSSDAPGWPSVNWLFSAGLDKGGVFDRLLLLADSSNLIRKQGDKYVVQMPGSTITLLKTDKSFTVASSGEIADKFESGHNNTAIDPAILQHFEGQPVAFYLNIHAIMQVIPEDRVNNEGKQNMEMMKGLFSDFYMTGGQVTKDAAEFKMELNFLHKDENSLIQLIRMGTKLYQQRDSASVSHSPTGG